MGVVIVSLTVFLIFRFDTVSILKHIEDIDSWIDISPTPTVNTDFKQL